MKKTVFKEAIQRMSEQELKARANELRKELFGVRLSNVTGQVKNTAQLKLLRKNVARVLTEIRKRTEK